MSDRRDGDRVPGEAKRREIELVPRFEGQGYRRELIDRRRRWLEQKAACTLEHVGAFSIPGEGMAGNIENPIGTVQVPLGVAGPLLIHGEHAQGTFYVPMATTEGALVRSYERGMVTLTRAGGVTARVYLDENVVSPVFPFESVEDACAFSRELPERLPEIRREAEGTTRHGKLLRIESRPVGRQVFVDFHYFTGDAHGMNMIVRATDRACTWIVANTAAASYLLLTGQSSEKRAAGGLLAGGKGKKVTAGARIPGRLLRAYLNVDTRALQELWRQTVTGQLQADTVGYNGQYANALAALFIACGQDVANLANAAVGITTLEPAGEEDLYASVTLYSLTVGSVGGGTGSGTALECLGLLGCTGRGQAPKLAEICAATVLAGELSMAAAIASGELSAAHETYGRNPPPTPAENES